MFRGIVQLRVGDTIEEHSVRPVLWLLRPYANKHARTHPRRLALVPLTRETHRLLMTRLLQQIPPLNKDEAI